MHAHGHRAGPLGGTAYLRDGLAGPFTGLAQTPNYSFAVAAGASPWC